MDMINWGIIGCGDVTEVKSGPAFNKVPKSRLAAVMRRNTKKAKDYASRHNVPKWYDNADNLINDPEVNAIYIATPPSSHMEYTIKAANAGKPVYVEKPMALDYNQCQAMNDICKKKNVKLFVAYYRRELSYFKKIKNIIDEGLIGDVKLVNIKLHIPQDKEHYDKENLPWRVIPEISGGGYFHDLASHQFDFLDYLFGPIISVSGNSANQSKLYNTEDIVSSSFKFNSNIIGSGSWCFTVKKSEKNELTEIIGTKGKIEFSFFNPLPIKVITESKTESFNIDYPAHVQQPLIQTIVSDLLGNNECVSTGETAARTSWVLDNILNK